jgi:hypothetical protein
MTQKQSLLLLVLSLALFSCVNLRKHKILINEREKLNGQLILENTEKKDFELRLDSLRVENYKWTNESIGYQQSSDLLQYQVDSLLLDLEERESSTVFLKDRLALLNENANKVYYKNIIIRKVDTVQQIAHEISTYKIAFYCPSEMYYKQTYDVYGLIANVLSDEIIKKIIVKKIKQHTPDSMHIDVEDKDFLIRAVQFYEIIELNLDNAVNKGFDIVKIHLEDQQIITNKMETWHWKVTPHRTSANQQLVLKIIIRNEKGDRNLAFDKTYLLNIKIKPSTFSHNTKMLFIENSAWTFATIILPLFTFLGGRYLRKKIVNQMKSLKKTLNILNVVLKLAPFNST